MGIISYEPRKSMNEDLDVWFGLPKQVKFCSVCNMSNQRPNAKNEYRHDEKTKNVTIDFDVDNICAACRNKQKQHITIDWAKREQELIDLCNKYRRTDGHYDCLVPGSGGKDSQYQAWMLKYKYGMHPLTVTWAPHMYTDVGWHNFQAWIHKGGFDNYLMTPNGRVHSLLTKLAVENLFHPFQPFIVGQKIISYKTCLTYDIPICFYGEMPGEYGTNDSAGQKTFNEVAGMEINMDFDLDRDWKHLSLAGMKIGDICEKYKLERVDFLPYLPISRQQVEKKHIEAHYLGYYLKWDPQECYYFSVDKTGFKANDQRTEGTYSKYNSLDDKVDNYFYYSMFIKFGFGRATHDASQEIRNKKITFEEGKALIKKFDGEFPTRYYKDFLEYIDMTDQEFRQTEDKFRSPHIWAKVNGQWKLRHTANRDGVDDWLLENKKELSYDQISR